MKILKLVTLFSALVAGAAHADFGGGPGFGDHDGFHRPPPPFMNPEQNLCQGVFVGQFSNGFNANFNMNPGFDGALNVYVIAPGQNYLGQGTCWQWGYQAQVEFVTSPFNYHVTANVNMGADGRAYMTGFVSGVNLTFNIVRQ